jgi:hypothetical protein
MQCSPPHVTRALRPTHLGILIVVIVLAAMLTAAGFPATVAMTLTASGAAVAVDTVRRLETAPAAEV